MVIALRRVSLNLLLAAAFMGVLLIAAAWAGYINGLLRFTADAPAISMTWWGVVRSSSESDLLLALLLITFYSLLGLFGEIFLRSKFGRNPFGEIFFLRLFLLLLPLQAARLVVLLAINNFIGYYPAMLATRFVWFCRLMGLLALLNISLFATEIAVQKARYVIGLGMLMLLVISVSIPVDQTQPLGGLLLRSGLDNTLALSCLFLEILVCISLAVTGMERQNAQYYFLALWLFFIVAGYDLSFLGSGILPAAGALLMLAGVISFSIQAKKIHQWL